MGLNPDRGENWMKDNDNTLNILIGGEAGQGLVTVGQLLAKNLVRSGLFHCCNTGLPVSH